MDKKTKVILVASIVIIAASLSAYTSLQQVSAKKFNGFLGDFYVNMPFQINATRGETLTIPVDIYGSTISRNVHIVVTGADSRRGILEWDGTHQQLPQGFSINFPIKDIQMHAMDKKSLVNPLMRVNMTIGIDNTVKSGKYGFAINMIDNNPQSGGDNANAFYVNVD